jgi:serine/threonine protein kinase
MEKYDYDPYDILGKGGFGNVYKGYRISDNYQVAIKVIWPFTEKILEEIKMQQLCKHDNIVEIYEWFIHDNVMYIIMEKLDCDLWIKLTNEQLTKSQIKSILYDILKALNFCHSQGIIHNDIKLENIVLNNTTGKAKLCDFGSASYIDDPPIIAGTQEYFSPEVIRDKYYNIKSDSWTFGMLVYELLTGFYPFGQNNYLFDILNNEPDYSGLKMVDKDLITKLLEKDPKKRITLKEVEKHAFFKKWRKKHSIRHFLKRYGFLIKKRHYSI